MTPSSLPTSQWLTTEEFASIYNRSTRTTRRWCTDGTLVEFGFSIKQDRTNRWWICYRQPHIGPN